MKKLLVPLLGIVAFVGSACEQHSAEEMQKAKAKHGAHDKATHPTEKVDADPAPLTPDNVPQNPAGSGPVGEFEQAKPDPKEQGNPPKFFPKK
ncbi:MAG: hypothetical protein ACO1QR_02130 [Chthoniobacteraceae bacterium]